MTHSLISSLRLEQARKCTRGLVENRDFLVTQQTIELIGRTSRHVRHDECTASVEQSSKQLPDREIERQGMEQSPDVALAEFEPPRRSIKQSGYVAVLDHYTFRVTG